jgi:hypothetical protein
MAKHLRVYLNEEERQDLEAMIDRGESKARALTRISSTSLLYALQRLNDLRSLGVSDVELHHLPPNQLRS